MNVDIGYLNESYSAEDEFLIVQYSGDPADLPAPIKDVLTVSELEQLNQGDWIMLVDGQIAEASSHHPHKIQWESGENSQETHEGEIQQAIYCPGCGDMIYHSGTHTSDTGMNCPHGCGWIEVEFQGEDLVVKSSPTSY